MILANTLLVIAYAQQGKMPLPGLVPLNCRVDYGIQVIGDLMLRTAGGLARPTVEFALHESQLIPERQDRCPTGHGLIVVVGQ